MKCHNHYLLGYLNKITVFLVFCLTFVLSHPIQGHPFKSNPNSDRRISSTIDLKGGKMICNENDTLYFTGGKIINGTVIFNKTSLINPLFRNCRFKGSIRTSELNVRDFGIYPNNEEDCSAIINDLIKLKTTPISDNNPKHLYFPKGTYYIDKPIEVFAGYESPVTLSGDGNMSSICQRSDNEYIIKIFEQNHIKDLRLTYKNKQNPQDKRSIAIACQRSIFSIFENLTICKAHTAFGYITLADQKTGYNPTHMSDQCYVSDNFRNIRVYDFTGYAFDFKKEFPQGDSGSAYDNIYITNSRWLGGKSEEASQGAIRGDNTIATFSQLNIEGRDYQSSLIELNAFSRISIQSLHIEGQQKMQSIANVSHQSFLKTDIIDIQFCNFTTDNYKMFKVKNNGIIDIGGLCIRPDCKFDPGNSYFLRDGEIKGENTITIANIIDNSNFLTK